MFRSLGCPVIPKTPWLQPHTETYIGLARGLSIGCWLLPAAPSEVSGGRFSSRLCTLPRGGVDCRGAF
jgi:hypothetical protein